MAVLLLLVGTVGGCKDLTGSPGLPSGTPNPAFYNNKTGALGMRNAAVSQLELALSQYFQDAGLLTDELEDFQTGASAGVLGQAGGVSDPLDERILPPGVTVGSYGQLQGFRTFAAQALGALAAYDTAPADTASAKVLRGELHAMVGYTEILLADLFCSGVPLSTLVFQHDYTDGVSLTTRQVYQAALAQFDTALTLAQGESDSVVALALIGKGRAHLDLGDFAVAADDVTTVPNTFRYLVSIPLQSNNGSNVNDFLIKATVSDQEGGNGLPFLDGDPRSVVDTVSQPNPTCIDNSCTGATFIPLTTPVKYQANAGNFAPFVLASGTEARLIEAENALQRGDTINWLTDLNELRTNGSVTVTVTGTGVDSLWQAGTGGVDSLPPLTDPGSGPQHDGAPRVALMFRERAYWFFLDGHRQGDLRRLLREYGTLSAFNSETKVYPTGQYLAPGTGVYGSDTNAPIPPSEAPNPNFHGCLSRAP